jgi:hypothetical protein
VSILAVPQIDRRLCDCPELLKGERAIGRRVSMKGARGSDLGICEPDFRRFPNCDIKDFQDGLSIVAS